MESVERIGVSLEKTLLARFDKLIETQGYQSRSEAIRDLVRQKISSRDIENPDISAVAAVCLVYDHHASNLQKKLTALQHSHFLQVISSMHIHLGHHDCMEIIVLKGKVAQIKKVAENLISQKGVKLGKINLVPAED